MGFRGKALTIAFIAVILYVVVTFALGFPGGIFLSGFGFMAFFAIAYLLAKIALGALKISND